MQRASIQNRILRRLSSEAFDAIEPHFNLVQLAAKQDVILPGETIETVYFMESGMCSLTAASEGAEAIEVGLIGREGMTDHVMGPQDTSALHCFVQAAGTALAVPAPDYTDWIFAHRSAFCLMFRYQQYMTTQVSFTALSHGSFTIEERLARWLLMSFDRHDSADLPFVHEFLSLMLAVRRAGVTKAIHVLEGHGAIRATRANIQLRDRSKLESLAAGSYGVPESEYERLLGPIPAP